MKSLTFSASEALEEYHSIDQDVPVDAVDGETIEVSDEKAEQLLADFADNFAEGEKPKRSSRRKRAAAEQQDDTLEPGHEGEETPAVADAKAAE
jgi:hypothetical protein